MDKENMKVIALTASLYGNEIEKTDNDAAEYPDKSS